MGKFIDITGQKFNRLTVVSRAENNKYKNATWNCICDCGNTLIVISRDLRGSHTKSCGCIQKEKAKLTSKDITGQKFGRLTVISRSGTKNRKATWNCVCECGTKIIAVGTHLRNSHIRSCGCLQKERSIGAPKIDINVRLEKSIDKSSGKWIWVGNTNKNGYGRITYEGKSQQAHRVVYELFVGEIPEGLCVCHKNDIPLDVTPDNLFLGTTQENTKDMVNKGRQSRGETSGVTILKNQDILDIRASNLNGVQLSAKYNVSNSTISCILRRKTWKHV